MSLDMAFIQDSPVERIDMKYAVTKFTRIRGRFLANIGFEVKSQAMFLVFSCLFPLCKDHVCICISINK